MLSNFKLTCEFSDMIPDLWLTAHTHTDRKRKEKEITQSLFMNIIKHARAILLRTTIFQTVSFLNKDHDGIFYSSFYVISYAWM